MNSPAGDYDLAGFDIHRQPDDDTCGPTCLHAVYRYFGDHLELSDLLHEVPSLEGGGTLGVQLATHAVSRGYGADIVTWNMQIFDPTWFEVGRTSLRDKLRGRAESRKSDPKMRLACQAYVTFLDAGGRITFRDLEPSLLRGHLGQGRPILTGLSASFLYREARENAVTRQPDDVGGDPVGHFVVLTGYRAKTREVLVTDPLHPNPLAEFHTYPVQMQRLIGAIYLGVLTYDANLIVLEPPPRLAEADR